MPHLYESIWDDVLDNYSTSFRLSPVSNSILELALEDWNIWRRWETAFHRGETTKDTHPALPIDARRHEELKRLLKHKLIIDAGNFVLATAEFRVRDNNPRPEYGMKPLEVKWSRTE